MNVVMFLMPTLKVPAVCSPGLFSAIPGNRVKPVWASSAARQTSPELGGFNRQQFAGPRVWLDAAVAPGSPTQGAGHSLWAPGLLKAQTQRGRTALGLTRSQPAQTWR